MMSNNRIPLVASEISSTWNSYRAESMLSCILKYFANRVDNNEIRKLLQHNINLSTQRTDFLRSLFMEEGLPIPKAFDETDVNINAPRLYTDALYLQYIHYISKVAMNNYTFMLNTIARTDLRDYFSKCIHESIDIFNESTELKLSMGIFTRAPRVEIEKNIQPMKPEGLMSGFLEKRRPLFTNEITNIFSIVNDTILRKAILIGFLQTCKNEEISNYLSKVIDLANKQNDIFTSILTEENIPLSSYSDSYVTDCTISPFSEKLILNKIQVMYAIKISCMGMALSDTLRSDLHALYVRSMDEATDYAKDSIDLMIKNNYFEQPPQAISHESLVGV